MWTRTPRSRDELLIAYDREMLRSAFVSLFWSIISRKKQHEGFPLKTLADKIGVHKSAPSRWFSGGHPNWTVNTISDIANALDLDLEIRAHDRKTGETYAPYGLVELTRTEALSPRYGMTRMIEPPSPRNARVKQIAAKPNVSLVLEDV
jgi:hypothetical protein